MPNDDESEKLDGLCQSVDQDSIISATAPDGNVGMVRIFKPKVSGLDHAMVVQIQEEDKEEREKQMDLMTVDNSHSFSAEGFFESQSMMTAMRKKDPNFYAFFKDNIANDKGQLLNELQSQPD